MFKLLFVFFLPLQVHARSSSAFDVQILFQGSDVIWGFDFLDAKNLIFTERLGAMRSINLENRKVTNLSGVPPVRAKGQGGLLDVRAKDKTRIFFSYSEPIGDKQTTAIASAEVSGSNLIKIKKLFSGHEPSSVDIHFGSRIALDYSGHLFFTMGDRDERDRAQNLEFNNGKVMRLNEDGSIPADNPYVKTKGARPEIWSFGHRNPQGLVWNRKTKELWEAEFGPRGGDEINVVKSGKNYGWPIITYGKEYWGPKIGEGTVKEGIEQPLAYYIPSISPSGIDFYHGDKFSEWNGNLFVANLSGMHLRRLKIENQKIISQEELLKDKKWRFRQVRQGPDEYLYFSTDEGVLGRLVPKN